MSKLYIVFNDASAGRMGIESVEENSNWTYQELGGCHANNVFESHSKEECEKYINDEIKESTRYVVFQKRDMDGNPYYIYEEMNCCSGTYQEVGGSYSNFITEFKTEEEAIKYVETNN